MLNPGVATFPISCRTGEGITRWVDWLVEKIKGMRIKVDER
jgi:hydrogenase nickel incorporation protein HypB